MRLRALLALLVSAALAVAPLAMSPASAGSRADTPQDVTWGVVPANTSGPDSRFSFAYGVNPGVLIQDQVAILNTGTKTTTFKLYAADALTDPESGAFALQDSTKKATDLGSWVHLSQNSVTVPAGQAVVVHFQVSVPTNASPGDHAAGILASITTNTTNTKGEGIKLEQRVGVAMYLRVAGAVKSGVAVSGLVDGFSPSWNPFGSGKASVDYQVKNTGNVRMDVAQDVVLKGPFGIPIAHLTTVSPVLNLLPGDETHVHVNVPDVPPLVLLFADVTLKPGPPTDSLAKSAEQNYDGTPAVPRPAIHFTDVTAETLTGAITWTLLLLILVIAGLIWLLVRYIRNTQLRMYDAIDQAAEEARESALQEVGAGSGRGPGL